MYNKFLTAASVFALMIAVPAYAQMNSDSSASERTSKQESINQMSEEDIEEGWNNAKDSMSDATEDVSEATGNAYKNVKAAVLGENQENAGATQTIQVSEKSTADGLIGEPVYNVNGDRIAKVKDIILDSNGNADLVILADGDFTGLGKMAAFKYDSIVRSTETGDVVAPLTEDMMDNAAEFSYEDDESGTSVSARSGYSVEKLLDADLQDEQGETLAEVENITFSNGEANHIIVSYDETLGLGGKKAALAYKELNVVRSDNDEFNFQLSANQAAQFKDFKNRPAE